MRKKGRERGRIPPAIKSNSYTSINKEDRAEQLQLGISAPRLSITNEKKERPLLRGRGKKERERRGCAWSFSQTSYSIYRRRIGGKSIFGREPDRDDRSAILSCTPRITHHQKQKKKRKEKSYHREGGKRAVRIW